MTLAEMRDSLRRKIGNPTTADVSDSTLNRLINEANRYIMDCYPFHASRNLWVIATVDGTKRYTLPTDLSTLLKVGHRTEAAGFGRIARADSRFQMRQGTIASDVTGIPGEYTRMSNWIELYPTPDGIYDVVLFYKTVIADMVLDADTSPIPLTWHPGIIAYARYIFYDEAGDLAKAQYAMAAWGLWVSQKPNELQDELAADFDGGVELPFLRGGNVDGRRSSRGFDYDE